MAFNSWLRVLEMQAVELLSEDGHFIRRFFACKEKLPWGSSNEQFSEYFPVHSAYLIFKYFVESGGRLSEIILEEEEYAFKYVMPCDTPSRSVHKMFWLHQLEVNVVDNVELATNCSGRFCASSMAISRVIWAYRRSYFKTRFTCLNDLDATTLALARAYSICIYGREELNLVEQLQLKI